MDGLTTQVELHAGDQGGSLEDENVKVKALWVSSSVYKVVRCRRVFLGRASMHGKAAK